MVRKFVPLRDFPISSNFANVGTKSDGIGSGGTWSALHQRLPYSIHLHPGFNAFLPHTIDFHKHFICLMPLTPNFYRSTNRRLNRQNRDTSISITFMAGFGSAIGGRKRCVTSNGLSFGEIVRGIQQATGRVIGGSISGIHITGTAAIISSKSCLRIRISVGGRTTIPATTATTGAIFIVASFCSCSTTLTESTKINIG